MLRTRIAQLAAIATVSLGLALLVSSGSYDERTELMLQPVHMGIPSHEAGVSMPVPLQQNTATLQQKKQSWYERHMSPAAQRMFAPVKKTGLLLNPGELAGELKDPDDPWGYSHPRCRGLPTCSDSTSSPAVKEHQQRLRKSAKTQAMSQISETKDEGMASLLKGKKDLTPEEQYAYITAHQSVFSPWSTSPSWISDLKKKNIEKSMTTEALEAKAAMIRKENAKFKAKFDHPHTAQYTGVHTAISDILDPRYQPWSNAGPRKAYYQGY